MMKKIICLSLILFSTTLTYGARSERRKRNITWANPAKAAAENPDFLIQGEYGVAKPKQPWAVQVIAQGDGKFEAYLLESGLPGLGYEHQKQRIKITGNREGDVTKLASGDKKVTAQIRDGKIVVTKDGRRIATLPRIGRKSLTLGKKPPKGAVVLFDGTSAEQWKNGKMENGLLANSDCTSIPKFKDYTLHLEFRTPYKPYARGQARGNSGVYHWGRYETQILDSFWLTGEQNECGGIYSIAKPKLNMCFPPLTWQTYDVEFTMPKFGEGVEPDMGARMTVKLNGVVIHNNVEMTKRETTSAPIRGILRDTPGPIFLQQHGNPVYFRNIWVVPR
jgi:hypothetical protein